MTRASLAITCFVAALAVGSVGARAAQAPAQPVPEPFPGAGRPTPSSIDSQPAVSSSQAPPARAPEVAVGEPTDAIVGVQGGIYPALTFLSSFDLGSGQRCYLFGTNTTFNQIVAYYKQILKDGGRTLFKTPAMQQFDLGKFQENAMAYPPSIVVKDYSDGEGYLHVDGTKDSRFKTVIQIVPSPTR